MRVPTGASPFHDALCLCRDPGPPRESSGTGLHNEPALVQQTQLQRRADPPVAVPPRHPQVGLRQVPPLSDLWGNAVQACVFMQGSLSAISRAPRGMGSKLPPALRAPANWPHLPSPHPSFPGPRLSLMCSSPPAHPDLSPLNQGSDTHSSPEFCVALQCSVLALSIMFYTPCHLG